MGSGRSRPDAAQCGGADVLPTRAQREHACGGRKLPRIISHDDSAVACCGALGQTHPPTGMGGAAFARATHAPTHALVNAERLRALLTVRLRLNNIDAVIRRAEPVTLPGRAAVWPSGPLGPGWGGAAAASGKGPQRPLSPKCPSSPVIAPRGQKLYFVSVKGQAPIPSFSNAFPAHPAWANNICEASDVVYALSFGI